MSPMSPILCHPSVTKKLVCSTKKKKRKKCNIPPVSIGILPVIVPEEINSGKSKLKEIFYKVSS
jgi:hypothetical protein